MAWGGGGSVEKEGGAFVAGGGREGVALGSVRKESVLETGEMGGFFFCLTAPLLFDFASV